MVKLSEFDLSDLSEKIDFTYDWVKKLKQKLETAILKKYTTEALETIHKNGSSFGIAVLNKNGYNVEVEIPKMIIWDQDKLRGIYKLCPREVKTIISVTYSVDEGGYEQLEEESKNMLGKAMTTRYGKVKVKITKENKK